MVWLSTDVELTDATVITRFEAMNDEYNAVSKRWSIAYEGKNEWKRLRDAGLLPESVSDFADADLVDAADGDTAQAAT